MPKLDASWTGRLRLIGDLERPDHWYLTDQDQCAFFGEYTARGGYGHSSTNQLILNLKKRPQLAETPQYAWKGRAIQDVAAAIRGNIRPEAFANLVVVPIPPSKPAGVVGYDDRMAMVAHAIGPNVDVREVLFTAVEREAMHANQAHRDPAALRATLALRPELIANPPGQVLLLDDVLTTGCSFVVCKSILREAWPGVEVFGVFAARRVIERPSAADDFAGVEF